MTPLSGFGGRWSRCYSTTIEPFMFGWNSQKYSMVPAVSKVCVNDAPGRDGA